jgi:hypothetical protein
MPSVIMLSAICIVILRVIHLTVAYCVIQCVVILISSIWLF